MSARDIYAKLIAAGMTHEGTCGLMGNMQAESGMKSNIAQRGMTELSDREYTASAAEWPVKFIHDGVGYGLCQWTYWSRKQALFNFAQERGASVGDEEMQVEFCISELKNDYPGLWALLCSVTVNMYGEDRIMFGSDYPMWDAGTELARLRSLPLSKTALEKIQYKNAAEFLSL